MERRIHDVREVNSKIGSRYNANKSIMDKDESTVFEGDDASSNAFTCLPEGVQSVTAVESRILWSTRLSYMPNNLPHHLA
eukprot:2294176-Ditylum_brightwellii.AAC.1